MLDNGIRYNHAEGSVQVTTGARSGASVLSVANTGPQVSEDAVATLVEPFHRLDQTRGARSDGHGLGLSIVKAVVEAHGATMTIDAPPGGGLCVAITWRCATEPEQP